MDLTDKQLGTLRHMLGINKPYDKIPKPSRNYAAVNPGDPEFVELEKIGAVVRCRSTLPSDYHYYQCTEAGKEAAMQSHRKIRHGKSKRVYWQYRGLCDCIPDLTFKEFLTNPEYAEIRKEA